MWTWKILSFTTLLHLLWLGLEAKGEGRRFFHTKSKQLIITINCFPWGTNMVVWVSVRSFVVVQSLSQAWLLAIPWTAAHQASLSFTISWRLHFIMNKPCNKIDALLVMVMSDFTFTFHFHALEKEMATHSSVLAWRIPGTGEPGGLLSMGSHRVGHGWSDVAAAAAATAVVLRGFRVEEEKEVTLS